MISKLVLNLPLRVVLGRTRKGKDNSFPINLNEYRNANFHTLNNAKVKFKEQIQDQLDPLPVFEWVEFEYFLYPGSNRDLDTNNICSIADKFFADAFVESGKLEDDNYRFLRRTVFSIAEVDKKNPRVEVHITGVIKEPATVQIQANLDNNDFMTALEEYVRSRMTVPEGKKVTFDITAGRGDKGYTAVVIFADPDEPEIAQQIRAAGRSTNRLGENVMPTTQEPQAPQTAPVEAPQPVQQMQASALFQTPAPAPTPLPEAAPKAMSGIMIQQPTQKADEPFQPEATEGESVEEAAPVPEAPKPLFSFPAAKA